MIKGERYNINTTTELVLHTRVFPPEIVKLTKLKFLKVAMLSSLPESIGKLTNLEELNLKDGRLTSLPESIGKLTKLEKLTLFNNKLTSLPPSIGKLTNLEYFNLGLNPKLTSLPPSFGNLTQLKKLYLFGTPITSLPKSIKKLRNTEIHGDYPIIFRSGLEFYRYFSVRRVTKNTELFNQVGSTTNKISNINNEKRVYINIPSNLKNKNNDFELRRLYNKNFIIKYMRGRNIGRLHGGKFNIFNVRKLTSSNIVNKNVYLRNIRARLQNSTLNNLQNTVNKIKTNLPSNVSRNDVNVIIRNMKPYIINKIFNKLKNSPSTIRVRLMNNYKNQGLMNNSDINKIQNKL